MMVTRRGGWRALVRTLLMQWWSQQASFRVTAHLKKKDASLCLPLLSFFSFFILPFASSIANLSEPHPLIRAHLCIGHCTPGWLGRLDRWRRPSGRQTDCTSSKLTTVSAGHSLRREEPQHKYLVASERNIQYQFLWKCDNYLIEQ